MNSLTSCVGEIISVEGARLISIGSRLDNLALQRGPVVRQKLSVLIVNPPKPILILVNRHAGKDIADTLHRIIPSRDDLDASQR